MELVAKLTAKVLDDLKHDIIARCFKSHIPVEEVWITPDFNDKNAVDIRAQLRLSIVDLVNLVSLKEDFCCENIDIGHNVEGREITFGLLMRGVPHENLNIETKF